MDYTIALLSGDGIGPEIMDEAVKVLEAVAQQFGHHFTFHPGLIGGVAIRETGNPFPDETAQICREADAILFGAIGDPKYDRDPDAKIRPEQGLLAMRRELGLFANIRPLRVYKELSTLSPLKEDRVAGTDLVIVRELTGGLYFGEPRELRDNGRVAVDTCLYSISEIERIARVAFELARLRRKKVTLVDKANVLETSRLWRRTVKQMAPGYPDIEVDFLYVDNAAMQLILNPARFDVILTENLFGDILSDESSVISGSIGLLPSASIGEDAALFEPIHGSYPEGTGKSIANPLATILSAAMMLRMALHLGEEATSVEQAVNQAIQNEILTPDLPTRHPKTTGEVGNFVAQAISGY
ncbi:MAG: 3-isopropylmalate dehydrogenase [Bacteroidales bacterium]|nr:3-isopropylmalate dehydrogenase [Bacteroidales bacterium]